MGVIFGVYLEVSLVDVTCCACMAMPCHPWCVKMCERVQA
jgi:hypothetical protein